MPAQPKDSKQPRCDCCRLGNDRTADLNVIELELQVPAIRLTTGEQES
jgi:hypothetical protein